MAIRGINTVVEVQSALASGKTISAITKASPGVVTATAHGYSNGDIVVLTIEGMSQLNGVACRISSSTTDAFTLEGIDTTLFSTFTSGTAQKVTSWDTFSSLQSISLPNQESAKLDITTIHDNAAQETLGLAGAVSGTMTGIFSPTETAVTNIRNATRVSSPRAFRITFETGAKAVFNSDVSAGQGFDLQQNAVATASYGLAIKKFISFYAS
jgi:hypothetical protein